MPRCLCNVGPGKYEGEGPETWLLHQHVMNHGADEEIPSEDGGPYHALVKGPFELTEPDARAAREAGFCSSCIQRTHFLLPITDLAILSIDTQGFVTSLFGMGEDIEPEWEALIGDYAEDESDDVVDDEE